MNKPDDSAGEFTEILSEIRHELRTPVSHIIGYAEMIEEELENSEASIHGHDLQAIQNAGQRILALIDSHLDPGKKSVDQIHFEDAQFNIRIQLNHIAGYTEMIREDAVEDDNQDLISDLDRISKAENNLVTQVEALNSAAFDAAPAGNKKAKKSSKKSASTTVSTEVLVGVGGDIMVVDDDPANRELLQRRLVRSGYTSTAVSSGEEALELLKTQRFDLILLDLRMPGISGLETLAEIQGSARLRTIPVIMLSASDDVNTMVRCILSGAEDYISKPFNPVLLTARINACLEKVRLRQNISRKLTVFISSPGDVIPERRAVKAVIGRLNEEFSERAYLIPILWEEEPLLASDTFQAQIHPPRDSDIYIGILWSRIGSQLPETIVREDGSRYESGTAFEYEDALIGYEESGSPEMLLYRKSGAPTVTLDDKAVVMERLEQIERLQAYIERWLIAEDGSYIGAFHMFSELPEFEGMIESHLRKLVENILSRPVQ